MHPQAYEFVRRMSKQIRNKDSVIEFGSRNVNGSVRDLFNGSYYVGIDNQAGDGVDLVYDASKVYLRRMKTVPRTPNPILDRNYSVVVCTEVLEHTEFAHDICLSACDMLNPGGVFIVTAAGIGRTPHSAVDGCQLREGEYYSNVHTDTLKMWLSEFNFVHIEHNVEHNDIYAVAVK